MHYDFKSFPARVLALCVRVWACASVCAFVCVCVQGCLLILQCVPVVFPLSVVLHLMEQVV